MGKLIRKIILLIISFLILDYLLGLILYFSIVKSPDGRYYKTLYSLDSCKEDIIIFGSSRAETNYAPFVLEDSLKMSCWNTGRGGQSLPFWYAVEKCILKRYTPKVAIINMEANLLSTDLDRESYQKAGFLRPFYYAHKEIRPIINHISWSERFLMISRLYAFNSCFYYLFRPYIFHNLDGKNEDKGWKPKMHNWHPTRDKIEIIDNNYALNKKTVLMFNNFINSLTDRGFSLFFNTS